MIWLVLKIRRERECNIEMCKLVDVVSSAGHINVFFRVNGKNLEPAVSLLVNSVYSACCVPRS